MIKYDTLYSKDSKNKIRIWRMERDGNKYRTISGLQDGEHVVSEWTIAEPKNIGRANATTAEEQATKECKALIKKQKETGYFESVNDVDNVTYFNPQLAHKWEDYSNDIDWTAGVYVSPKMDGMRTIINKNGASSRNGKEFKSFPHILRELKPIFDKFPSLILDGEIYTDKLSSDFNKIISLAKKTKPTGDDLIESEKYLEYWIFDCPSFNGGFHDRYTELESFINKHFKNNKWIKLCKHTLITDKNDIETYLNDYIKQGFEGLMVNTYNGKYLQKRSKELLKYKLFKDDEYELIDIIEGVGNRSGMFGYAKLKMENGKTFDSNARGNETFYTRLLNEKNELIGKMAIVRYQNLTPDGIPRFPVIVGIRDYE
jgi:DNA ligase 1